MASHSSLARDLVFDRTRDAVVVVDDDGRVIDHNPAGASWLHEAEDVGAGPDGHVASYPALIPLVDGAVPEDGQGPRVEVGERAYETYVYGLVDDGGRSHGRVIVLREVTRQAQVERLLRTLATTDELTRVPNRRQFLDLARRAAAQARRGNTQLSWLRFDIDDFRSVNERHGRSVGDLVLQSVAAIASAGVRAGDALGRIGDDDFALCLPDTGPGGAAVVAERLRASVADLRVGIPGGYAQVTVSIGMYVSDGADADGDVDTALARAEEALEGAKDAGGDRVVSVGPAAS